MNCYNCKCCRERQKKLESCQWPLEWPSFVQSIGFLVSDVMQRFHCCMTCRLQETFPTSELNDTVDENGLRTASFTAPGKKPSPAWMFCHVLSESRKAISELFFF